MADLDARRAIAMRASTVPNYPVTENATPKIQAPMRPMRMIAALSATLMLGACAQLGGDDGLVAGLDAKPPQSEDAAPLDPQKAVEYRGKEYNKDPRDLDKALAYAKSLKTIGEKGQALAVLQQASLLHGADKHLASDYGRLALEMDQVTVAEKLLEVADDPGNPDWRVIMARGTVLAKQGRYQDSIPYYERALALQPDQPSIKNNLALAYAMSGEAEKGEELLRQASASSEATAKVRQNLALVLGLQGKYEESTKVGSADETPENAQANSDLLKKIVRLDPRPMATAALTSSAAVPSSAWDTQVADDVAAPRPAKSLKRANVDVADVTPEQKVEKVAASPEPVFKPSTQ